MKLKDIAYEVKDGFKPSHNAEFNYVGLEHVPPNDLHISGFTSSLDIKSSTYSFKKGDILFGKLRPYFRKVAIAPFDGVCSTEFALIRPKSAEERDFVFYAIAQNKFIEWATTKSNGQRPRTKWDWFSDFELKEISHNDRIVIGKRLRAYDDLIENNRRRIALLEEAARLLYREWFVHFRFPNHENTKFENGLPVGWDKKPLAEIASIIMGQSPKSEFYNENGDGLPFHQGVTDYGVRFVSDRVFSRKITKLAEVGDILFSVRAPVGRLNYTLNKMILGRGLAALRTLDANQSHLFYALKNAFFKEDIIGGGSIFAATNKKELEKFELVYPDMEILSDFNSIIGPLDEQIKTISLKNLTLTKARDLLLPRLMDGRITV